MLEVSELEKQKHTSRSLHDSNEHAETAGIAKTALAAVDAPQSTSARSRHHQQRHADAKQREKD